ncbi:sugar ABC transporter ATP-binding protein [Mycolicibacterium cosmeticum]|uniref:ABC transporter--like protein n=1 Tax=Mycolicibacterium cosmeticum TaxID=258533 RepID=W9B1B9_MYCCO|nr:ATP-binding cassette domain-containing protein [Mycolicibacterium cosmeticum]TLH73194.1 sugar ABC transporter ATP-binding protein [Mycolicibacterium cosmeticum]CDO08967.1 ABC transporter--like protein [Mycolicibacterium cosmeticum]
MSDVTERRGDGPALVEIRGLTKSFDAVRALQGIDLTITQGTVTALLGDNGAGKSTLVRCLTGVHTPDEGEIRFRGEPITLGSPDDARHLGIETVFQDLGLIEDLQVWQNLFLNRELTRGVVPLRVLDKKQMIAKSATILADLDVNVPDVRATVRHMSGGQRQSVAIARAANWGTTLVIMDEPTAALGVRETAAVEKLIARLRSNGVTVLLVSHDMDQVMRVADSAWILRRGRTAAHRTMAETTGGELVGLITGAIAGDADA